MSSPTDLAQDLDRVAAVLHVDPHRVLGPHPSDDGGYVVRAFRPGASAVRVLRDGAPPLEAKLVRDAGVFEARVSGAERPRYRLEVVYPSASFVLDDPYAFAPTLGELDVHLAHEGTHDELYRTFGAHVRTVDGVAGTSFSVWAPAARRVSVTGDFNAWDGRLHAMRRMGDGIWEIFIPGVGQGALYKLEIVTFQGPTVLKADPYGRAMELRPNTASKVTERHHVFADDAWMRARSEAEPGRRPLAIYEVHLGSWRRVPRAADEPSPNVGGEEPTRWMTYRELAETLVDYVADMGFSHIELLPVMEHPYDGSWGYQVTGYFAPTSRYGSPDDLRYFIDRCHQRGIGVILDWPPAHFPKDAFALGRFDGTAVYEHLDPRRGEHRHWRTYVFNYGRNEVRNFLISNALYWLDEFHVDGLRVDAVASMLYLDYGASHPGQWVPNEHGGREDLEAITFLRELCDRVHRRFPGAIVVAEESTAWPGVTRPTYLGGLGFDFKWNMGWMHDTLDYMKLDPIHRAFHHGKLTFGLMYAFSERFVLPLSHDEVVHLKKSLLSKMPGDAWKMAASLRLYYAYMWAHPGKKLLFMGGEIGQWAEWNEATGLDWHLLEDPRHQGIQRLVRDANRLYVERAALHELDDRPDGFSWIDPSDAPQSVASFVRYAAEPPREEPPKQEPPGEEPPRADLGDPVAPVGEIRKEGGGLPPPSREERRGPHVVFIGNFTPIPRRGYRVGVPGAGRYREVLNTDAREYGGSGVGNLGAVEVEDVPSHGFARSIVLSLPPLGALWLEPEEGAAS